MEYNSAREKLAMKEYGRHVQKIVESCTKIKDVERRNQFAKELIELMGQLNPHLRNVEDFRHKLWDHLFIMSGYKLQVDSPYPIVKKEDVEKKPKRLPYPQSKIKYKHYGKNVETLVAKAVKTEDPDKKAGFTQCIGNFMKLVYQNWSKENVNDETIKNDLRLLSKGDLIVADDHDINSLARANKMKKRPEENRKGGGGKFRHGGGHGGGQGGGGRNKYFNKKKR